MDTSISVKKMYTKLSKQGLPLTKPPANFQLFPNFTVELRLRIWRHCFPGPRVVTVEWDDCRNWTYASVREEPEHNYFLPLANGIHHTEPHPTIFAVNCEFRSEAQKHYMILEEMFHCAMDTAHYGPPRWQVAFNNDIYTIFSAGYRFDIHHSIAAFASALPDGLPDSAVLYSRRQRTTRKHTIKSFAIPSNLDRYESPVPTFSPRGYVGICPDSGLFKSMDRFDYTLVHLYQTALPLPEEYTAIEDENWRSGLGEYLKKHGVAFALKHASYHAPDDGFCVALTKESLRVTGGDVRVNRSEIKKH